MRRLSRLGAFLGLVASLIVPVGCGAGSTGGAGSGSGGTQLTFLLKDAPLVAVNGKAFDQVNVDITGVSVRLVGAADPMSATLASVPLSVNLLDLTSDHEWLAVLVAPPEAADGGRVAIASLRLTIDPATATLVEAGTGVSTPLVPADPTGALDFAFVPPLVVDTAESLAVIDWRADRSVRYDPGAQTYVLAGSFHVASLNRASTPVVFRALPARIASVDAATGDLRVRLDRHLSAQYLVRTANAAVLDAQGESLSLSDLRVGDLLLVSGTVDANQDIDATRLRLLPTDGPHSGTFPDAGHQGPSLPLVALGVVRRLDTTGDTFELRTGRGELRVRYGAATVIVDARRRPPAAADEGALEDGALVEVVGPLLRPMIPGGTPTIDAAAARAHILRIR